MELENSPFYEKSLEIRTGKIFLCFVFGMITIDCFESFVIKILFINLNQPSKDFDQRIRAQVLFVGRLSRRPLLCPRDNRIALLFLDVLHRAHHKFSPAATRKSG